MAAAPKVALSLSLALLVVMLGGLTRLDVGDDWFRYIDERYEFRMDTDFVVQNFSGVDSPEFSLASGVSGGVSEPSYVEMVDRFATWLRTQPDVEFVYSFADIIKRLNMNMHGDDPAYYVVPELRDEIAQYLLVYELSLAYKQDLTDRIDISKSTTRLTAVGDFPTAAMDDFNSRARDWLIQNAPEHMQTESTGMSMVFARISQRNIEGMLGGTLLALFIVSGTLVIALGWRLGFISLIPNIVPAAAGLGVWGWLYSQVGLSASVVGAVTLGIVVDDTIHFLDRYRQLRSALGHSAKQAVEVVFGDTMPAVVTTTIALVAGFAMLGFSGFQVNWTLGLLTAITIFLALLFDALLLPALLLIRSD